METVFHCPENEAFEEYGQCVRTFDYTEYSVEPHNHDFYEMNVVLGGRGIHQIEGATFDVKKGDVFVIPPMTTHAYYNTEHLEVYHILLKKDFIRDNHAEAERIPGYLQLMEIEPFLRQNGSSAMFLHLNPMQLAEVRRDFKYIEGSGEFASDGFLALKKHIAWKIIYLLSHLLLEQTVRGEKTSEAKYSQQILDTLEYLHHHFSEKITVEHLAERVYLSRSTFLRNFQSVCGCSPMQYLNRCRTKKAMELLELSKMSKTEIAHFCGFYDLSHMKRSIKKSNTGAGDN